MFDIFQSINIHYNETSRFYIDQNFQFCIW